MSRLTIRLLGSPVIEIDGVPLDVDTRKAIALLAYLAVNGQQQRDTLATLLWPEADQSRARAALRRTLSTLSAALGGRWLTISREIISLTRDPDSWLDIDAFHSARESCSRDGRVLAREQSWCRETLTTAAELYRGDFMAGFGLRDSPEFDDWQTYQADLYRRDFGAVLERLVICHAAVQAYDQAIHAARRWLLLDSLNEDAQRWLMLAYVWSGQRGQALKQYQESSRILADELGVEPMTATTDLFRAIQERREPSPSEVLGLSVTQAEQPPVSASPDQASRRSGSQADFPFVGRAEELNIIALVHGNLRGDGHLIVVEGEAGIGKTRLAEEALERAKSQGARIVPTRCYEGEDQFVYGPILEGLRNVLLVADEQWKLATIGRLSEWVLVEVSRLLPELRRYWPALATPPPLASPGSQTRFFDALFQFIIALTSGETPGVLFVDDIHWIDAASFDLLSYMARRLPSHPLLILVTWRTEQVPEGHRLRRLLAEIERSGHATHLELNRLSNSAVRELVQQSQPNGKWPTEQLSDRIYQETEGIPFFLTEYLRDLQSSTEARSGDAWSLPYGVRELLAARLAATSERERTVLSAAAVIGRSFAFDTLKRVSGGTDEETLAALDGLLERHLIVEVDSGAAESGRAATYDFGHDKLRVLVYDGLSAARRQLLHRRVAESLQVQSRSGDQHRSLAAQIAQHYRLAGQNAEAALYLKIAGDIARDLFANIEAISHYRSSLDLGYPDAPALQEIIGDLYVVLGQYGLALDAYLAVAAAYNPDVSPAVERKLGSLYHRLGYWDAAEEHFLAAETATSNASDQGSIVERARLYADWSLMAHRSGDNERALSLAQQALELAQTTSDMLALAQAHNLLGILARSVQDLSRARHHLMVSLDLARQLSSHEALVAALNNLALVQFDAGESDEAVAYASEALALSAERGDRHREAALHSNLADFLYFTGKPGQAMEHLTRSAEIYAEIGVVAGEMQPEIWKLAEW